MGSMSFTEIWASMGLIARAVVFVLAIMSVYMLYVTFDRLLMFVRARSRSIEFVRNLAGALGQRNVASALQLAQAQPQPPIARVVAAGLTEYVAGVEALKARGPMDVGDFDVVEAVNRAIDRVKEREIADLRRGLGVLASIASAAPFVGLFGTVVGIIGAFHAIGETGQGGLASVSASISEALWVTAFGLLVAIPSVLLYNYFTNRVDDFTVDMNDVSSELLSFVLKEGRK